MTSRSSHLGASPDMSQHHVSEKFSCFIASSVTPQPPKI